MLAQRPHNIGLAPNGPQGVRCTVPVTLTSLYGANSVIFGTAQLLDLTMEDSEGAINNVQSVFVDASLSPSAWTLYFPETGQTLWINAKTQGYYSIACGAQVQMQARAVIPGGAGYSITLQFFNSPIQPAVWSTRGNDRVFTLAQNNVGNTAITLNPLIVTPTMSGSGPGQTTQPGLYANPWTGKFNLVCYGFDVSGTGATAGGDATVTIGAFTAGLGGTNSIVYDFNVPVLGAGSVNFGKRFDPPLYPAGGNTSWTMVVSAMGAGQTFASAALFFMFE